MSEEPYPKSIVARLWAELKNRHVIQTAVIYVLVGLGVIEFVDIVFGAYGISESSERLVIGLVLAGFPAALAAAWFLEWNRGQIRVRSAQSGLPRVLVAVGAAVVIAGPVIGAVAVNLQTTVPAPESSAPAVTAPAVGDVVIEIFEPAAWASDSPAVLVIEEGTTAMMHGAARYSAGIERVLLDGLEDGQQRMSIGLSDSARFASFTGFVDPAEVEDQLEIVVLASDGRYASRSLPLRKESATPNLGDPSELFERRRSRATSRASTGNHGEASRWAVFIGISEYASEVISDVTFAGRDASALYDFFRSAKAGRGGIPTENMILLLDEQATADNIRSALSTFLRAAAPEDEVIVFLAGHGAPDPFNPDELYLLAYDTKLDDMAATAVPVTAVREMIGEADGYTKLVLADLTHSAGVAAHGEPPVDNRVNDALLNTVGTSSGGFVAFTASESNQLSRDGEEYGGGHGIFTYHLLEALNGTADENGDRVVSLGELVSYTRDRVRLETSNAQVPSASNTTYDNHWPMALVLDR